MTQVTDKVNTSGSKNTRSNVVVDWFIRLIKGIIVGIGFILPGLSGGVLAVIWNL
jgi:putative membrane protein